MDALKRAAATGGLAGPTAGMDALKRAEATGMDALARGDTGTGGPGTTRAGVIAAKVMVFRATAGAP